MTTHRDSDPLARSAASHGHEPEEGAGAAAQSPKASTRPLEGITVVSLEHAVAAPFCTRQLADLGARVIKIERPGAGDFARQYDTRVLGESSYFVWINRNKESLTLDVKSSAGQNILHGLLREADVLVQNLAPGAAARLGLSAEALQPTNPRLIVCDISGYGDDGPYRDKKAYDLLIQAEAGLLSVTGTPDQVARAGISVADIAAGMYAYSAILAALLQRQKTGHGSRIDVSMLEALAEWMGNPMYYSFDGQAPAPRSGASHPSIYPYGPFTAGDGRTVLFGLQNDREWALFCRHVLDRHDLIQDARFANNSTRSSHRAELKAMIESIFSGFTAAEVVARLERAGIGSASVNSPQDLWSHPQLKARDRWVEVQTPGGPVPALKPPARHDGFSYRMDPVPALGSATDAILQTLGYSVGQIQQLRTEGVV
ncbi:MAG: CaiB/BaiF CoA transferase family protein [Pigmentiphaga sp.]